ncbi:MAG: undecaprenyl-phosphate glucose phosphotransferase [Hyphomicrobium sp.]
MSVTLISQSAADPHSRGRKRFIGDALSIAIVVCNAAAIVGTSVLSGIAYHVLARAESGNMGMFVRVGTVIAAVMVITEVFRGQFQLSRYLGATPRVARIAQRWTVSFIFLLMLGFLFKQTEIYSRGWLILYYFSGLTTLLLLDFATVQLVRRSTGARLIATKRIFLVGLADEVEQFLARHDPQASGIEIVGCRFLDEEQQRAPARQRKRALQTELEGVVPTVRLLEPDAVYILTSWSDQTTIDGCVESLLTLPVEVHLGPDYAVQKYSNAQLLRVGPVPSLQLVRLPLTVFEQLQKRAFDVVVSLAGLVLISPFLLLVAVLIKLDSPGPAFFLQRRYGFNQKPFRIIKFRTMTTMDDGPVVPQATKGDPRVTRIGRWLRSANIDELPQLINVLRGEMSLVGPRPHVLAHDRQYERTIARYAVRHNVKPGITGLAQVNGVRGETDTIDKMQKRIEYDLFYVENWSLIRDIAILMRTVLSPKAYRNAH